MRNHRFVSGLFVLAAVLGGFLVPVAAHAALTVTPTTWNIIGLDSNVPTAGPRYFPVGVRVCSDVATTNVVVNFVWDTANPNVNLRAGSPSTLTLPSISAGGCVDAYFEVEVNQVAAAYGTTRGYHITADDGSGVVSTPVPRELYVERLISQGRNSFNDLRLNGTSIPAGGSMNLLVGNTYTIELEGGTATQGYNQFEAFINFPNTIFQILSVSTTYSADDSPFVPNPNPALYADACLWENDPNSPNYRACVGGDFKAGGTTVITTYTIRIISGGGTSQTLNALFADFSGSSYHYNADFSTGFRTANIIDPTSATIAKSFSPNPAPVNGVSALTITLGNPNAGTLSGYNFVDNLPANLIVAATPGLTTTGCGTPTLTAAAGSSSISFSNGTLAANSTCIIKVNVTPTATGSLVNTTNNLFIDTVNTNKTATATLTVNTAPPAPPPVCGQTLAQWTFPTGFNINAPAPTVANVTASAAPGSGVVPISSTNSTITADGTSSWGGNGSFTTGATLVTANHDYFEFALNTTGYSTVSLTFDALFKTPNGPRGLAVFYGTTQPAPAASDPGTIAFSNANAMVTQNSWSTFGSGGTITLSGAGLNPSGTTFIRIYGFNSGNTNPGSDLNLDNISFTGCIVPLPPTLSKSFSPSPVAVGASSILTFTVTNPNPGINLTGIQFTDTLPAGLTVASAASAQCGGTLTTTAPSTISFSGGSLIAGASCAIPVTVTATTSGPHINVSGFVSSTEGGTNSGSTGVATATLTAVLPPVIDKQFAPNPILTAGTSTLTFTITNPNQNDALSGVAFSDTFPTSPGAMTVAAVPGASTSGCGAPVFAPVAAAPSISFSGGTIAGGGTCTVTVNVTATVLGTYNNTSGNVSHIINAAPVNGNTASDSLSVVSGSPSVGLLKEVGSSASGPWGPFLATTAGQNVFYRFTVENTGNVALVNIGVTDNTLPAASLAGCTAATLPVAVAANDNHIFICVVGPFTAATGSQTNTATATANGGTVTSPPDSATYATTGLTLAKSVTQTSYQAAGDVLNYSYLVTNSGFAPLAGPVTVSDDKATVTCPAVSTVGDLDNFLDPAESMTCTAAYTITATDVANGSVTNTASASAGGVNSTSTSRTVNVLAADLSIVKTLVTAGPYFAGQTITYTLFVANAGPSTATNIQVTDAPTNLTITNVSGAGCIALPCTIPSLASGANGTITVTATINAAGIFDNSATVTATEVDPNTSNNTDNTGNNGTTGASADISVVKTLTTAGPFTAGQTITYTLLIANAGPSSATSIQVTDTPTNLSITNVSGSGCAALPCTLASLASGANTSITVTATINAAGAFDNSASVTAVEFDPNTSNNTDNTGNNGNALPSADISVVKTLTTAGPFTAGQTITYTLMVANAGPSSATNIQVTDTPSNLTITSVNGGGCAALPCTIANLAAGTNVTVTVTATINAAGAFDNSTSVTAVEFDPNTSNNIDNTGNNGNAVASADISVVKTLTTAGPFNAGQTLTYTLVVANAGPSAATNIQVTDTPSNLTITNVSGSGCAALPCTIANLAVGANTTINVTATITAAGVFDNSATVTGTEFDPNPLNNTDNTGNNGSTGPSADVSVVKTLTTGGPFIAGQTVSYTLVVANAGPSPATNIQVTDTPSNLSITSVSGSGCVAMPCTIPNLAVGANTTITVTGTINAPGIFDNSTTVTATEFDPNTTNNTDNTGNSGTTGPSADISVVKTLLTAGPFSPGQTISYTLLVANAGPSPATSILVTDTPTNLTISSVAGGGCAALPCTIASLAVGANVTVIVTATINAPGTFDNSTTVSATEFDPNTTNNTDNTGNGGVTSVNAVDLAISKTASVQTLFVGQTFDYIIVVTNNGPATATGVVVNDPLPLTFTLVQATSSQGSCTGTTNVTCSIGPMLNGATVTITLRGTVQAAGQLNNTATVSANETETVISNNTASAAVIVGASANIPTVSEVGLGLMALMLAMSGALIIRSRF